MKLDSLKDMVSDYERRTGEKVDFSGFYFDKDGGFHNQYNEYFHFQPHTGFVFWSILDHDGKRYFSIGQTYGNFHEMCPYMRSVMKANNLTDIITCTTRNPKVHQRRWHCKWLKDEDYTFEGRRYHVFVNDISNLY